MCAGEDLGHRMPSTPCCTSIQEGVHIVTQNLCTGETMATMIGGATSHVA